jgi:hypothetical protein
MRLEDQGALVELVKSDGDTAKRLEACRRITVLAELRALAGSDIDAGVREVAMARYRKLLCGLEPESPLLADRLSEIPKLDDDQQNLRYAALNAKEPELRLAAIERLRNPEELADCVLKDPVTGNRVAATQRLADKGALERVAREIGKRDKNVYRIARCKLKEITEREALPKRIRSQCEDLCMRLERLGRFENWVKDRALLDLLDRQWSELAPQADAEWSARYREERDRFLAAYESYRLDHEAQMAEEEARAANHKVREALLEELKTCRTIAVEQELDDRLRDIDTRWKDLDPLDEESQRTLERRYAAARQGAEAHLNALQTRRKIAERLRKMTDSARKNLNQSRPIDRNRAMKLISDAESLLSTEGIDRSFSDDFSEVRVKLEERLRKQVRHAEERLDEAADRLAELTESVESGELRKAEPLYQSLHASLDLAEMSGLPHKELSGLRNGLRSLGPRLHELQKWRKFGSDTHREGLCQAMLELEHADVPLEAKASKLHALQMEWKELDKGGSPVNQRLWDRFHAASDKVYAACKPYLDQQAAERESARAEREALCTRLEDFLDQVDWERIDWKQTSRAEREMRKGWAALGEVDGRHRRALEKRFRSAMKRLDDRLSAERNANQELKRGLIERVETLAEMTDLDRAIDETKRLQREWKTTVPARQKDENKLWQRFRAACDAVFARRRQRFEAQEAELLEHLKVREAICADAESLVGSDLDPAALQGAMRSVEARWRDTEPLPLPRHSAGVLYQRWKDARSSVQRGYRERLAEQRRESLALLARQAEICSSLERSVEAGNAGSGETGAAQAAWESLPIQSDQDLQRSIETRFQSAMRAPADGGVTLRASFPENTRRRAEICLYLEILAQIDSPPELTQERLAFQVNRLKEHMRDGEKDPLTGAAHLLENWYTCGPAPADEATGLEMRFDRARRALEQGGSEGEAAK